MPTPEDLSGNIIYGNLGIAQGIAWWVIPLAAVGNAAGSYLIKFLLAQKNLKNS